MAWNFTSHPGRPEPVPWIARHNEAFDGLQIPFGARVSFAAPQGSKLWLHRQPYAGRTVEGIFLGWEMKAGCKFGGTYRVALINDFDNVALRNDSASSEPRVNAMVTTRITWPNVNSSTVWDFPPAEK